MGHKTFNTKRGLHVLQVYLVVLAGWPVVNRRVAM
jgi:hypothetical protein